MTYVAVQNADGSPLMPMKSARAQKMLDNGKAKVANLFPFAIRLTQQVENPQLQPVTLGIDTGSKALGVAIVSQGKAVFIGEVKLKQFKGGSPVGDRSMYRDSRRSRKVRHREARFNNRTRKKCKVCGRNTPKSNRKKGGRADLCRPCAKLGHRNFAGVPKKPGWISPTLLSKAQGHLTVVNDLAKFYPISRVHIEVADWDIQKIKDPDIAGEEYQNGPLAQYENIRAYVYARDNWTCQYCRAKDVRLTVDHIIPKSRGGPTVRDNLITACETCNVAKSNRTAEEWGFPNIQERVKKNTLAFKHMAHVGSIKTYLVHKLSKRWPVRTTYGYYTRIKRRDHLGLPKSHGYDAVAIACDWGEIDAIEVCSLVYLGRLRSSRIRRHYTMLMFPQYQYKPRSAKGKKLLDEINAKLEYHGKDDPSRLRKIEQQMRALKPESWPGKGYFVPAERNKRVIAKDGTIYHRGDYVESKIGKDTVRGYITAIYSSGRIKIWVQEKEYRSAMPDKTRKLQSVRPIMWRPSPSHSCKHDM